MTTVNRLCSQRRKINIKENYENPINLIIHDHYLVKSSRVITLDKLTSTEIYSIYSIFYIVLFFNKKCHTFGIKASPLCSFCNLYHKTPYHMFYECYGLKCLWSDLVQFFQNNLILPSLTLHTSIIGFLDYTNNYSIFKNNKCLSNHILLIFKLYVYKYREKSS